MKINFHLLVYPLFSTTKKPKNENTDNSICYVVVEKMKILKPLLGGKQTTV